MTSEWRAFEHDHDTAFGDGESLASVDQRVHAELDALLADPTSLLHRVDAPPRDRESHVADQVGRDVGARRLGVGRVADESAQRLDHHDRDEVLDADVGELQRRSAARRDSAKRHADRGEVQAGADQCEGVEEFVVAEDAG